MASPGYPNQQLSSVTLDFCFKGRFAVLATLAELQERHAERFDRVLVPNVQIGSSPTLQPFWLQSTTQPESLLVALNAVSYRVTEYQGFTAFVAAGLPLLQETLALSKTTPERVQYRYENAIGIGRREDGTLGLVAVLRKDRLDAMFLGACTALSLEFRQQVDGGELVTRLALEAQDVLRLDLLAVAHIASGDVAGAVQRAHELASTRFEDLICDEFRAELKGEEGTT